MKQIFFIIFLSLLFFSLFFNVVFARGLVPCGGCAIDFVGEECPQPEPDCDLCLLFVMFGNVVNFILFKIIPSLAALMIAIGGFMYIFAYSGIGGGGPEWINRANSLFKSVIIGLLIAYGAWLLVNAFFFAIGVQPDFMNWNTICNGQN